ncbi:MAG: methylaspartate ammonia-lyase [Arenicella sp.]
MRIVSAHFISGKSAFYFDDQQSIKNGIQQDGFMYVGPTETTGFTSVRQEGECISILLELENGAYAKGDCAAVQYSGMAGRDSLFSSEALIPYMEQHIRPLLEGRDIRKFKLNSVFFDSLKIHGKRLHTAIRYGLSQALLDATAIENVCTKTEVLCAEYGLPLIAEPIPLFGQSGDDRYTGVDKMIIKKVDALPHALINNIPNKLGVNGEKLKDYIQWMVERITRFRADDSYLPDIHIDVYGTIGILFEQNAKKIASYIAELQEIARPFNLYIEGPVDAGGHDEQIESLAQIKYQLNQSGSQAKLVADEWCNTYQDIVSFVDAECCDMVQIKTPDLGCIHNIVDAILYCKQHGMEAYQGGTCNETDVSAQTCVHVALAARPERMLVKPGMGFDEGLMIVGNEMSRSLAIINRKLSKQVEQTDKAKPRTFNQTLFTKRALF